MKALSIIVKTRRRQIDIKITHHPMNAEEMIGISFLDCKIFGNLKNHSCVDKGLI